MTFCGFTCAATSRTLARKAGGGLGRPGSCSSFLGGQGRGAIYRNTTTKRRDRDKDGFTRKINSGDRGGGARTDTDGHGRARPTRTSHPIHRQKPSTERPNARRVQGASSANHRQSSTGATRPGRSRLAAQPRPKRRGPMSGRRPAANTRGFTGPRYGARAARRSPWTTRVGMPTKDSREMRRCAAARTAATPHERLSRPVSNVHGRRWEVFTASALEGYIYARRLRLRLWRGHTHTSEAGIKPSCCSMRS